MRFKTGIALLIIGALAAIGLMVWPGCAMPPIRDARKPIGPHTKADFKAVKSKHPTRSEVVSRLGEPHDYFPELRVASYQVNTVKERNLVLCLFVIPISVEYGSAGIEHALIQFDDEDRAQRLRFVKVYTNAYLRQPITVRAKAADWVSKKSK